MKKDIITISTPRGNLFKVALLAIQRELRMRKQNTFVYCPNCNFEMCSMNNAIDEKDGLVKHTCLNCGKISFWNYDCIIPLQVNKPL
jgi:predicted RNA-binding Zn-ribbon protein involved in translation (DUF1610 family)